MRDLIVGQNGIRYDVGIINDGATPLNLIYLTGFTHQTSGANIFWTSNMNYALAGKESRVETQVLQVGDLEANYLSGVFTVGAYSIFAQLWNPADLSAPLAEYRLTNAFNVLRGMEVANGGFETGNFSPEWGWEENIRGEDDVEPIVTREILTYGHSGNYSCSMTVKPENTNPNYALWASIYVYNKQVSIGTATWLQSVDFSIWIDLRTQMVDGADVLSKMYTWVCEYDASNNLLARTQTNEISPSDLEWRVYTKFSEIYTIQNPNCHHLGYAIEIVTKDIYGFEIHIDDLTVA